MATLKYPRVRDVLNKIRFTGNLSECFLVVEDRVTGTKTVGVERVGRKAFDAGDATIPYYKVRSIIYQELVIWERPK